MIYEVINIQEEGSLSNTKLYLYLLDNSPEINPDRVHPVVVITSGEFAHRSSFEKLLGDRYDELVEEMSFICIQLEAMA